MREATASAYLLQPQAQHLYKPVVFLRPLSVCFTRSTFPLRLAARPGSECRPGVDVRTVGFHYRVRGLALDSVSC